MKVYPVGGAVRDELLGLTVRERDWVVVGSTPEEMLEQGYKSVGRDFPVFLHPETHEEYALARTERKTAPGYHGFVFHTSPEVTLEDDLGRRDLTVNAIARNQDGSLIDPYGGERDIKGRVLRHVSAAFTEDPVRVLRVARFMARFHSMGFTVAEETRELMAGMVASGEIDALVPERVWAETVRALSEDKPSVFFEVLRECGALKKLFPELDGLFGIPQTEKWHPEIDTGIHTMMVLDQAARLTTDTQVRFATLVHDLGKGATPEDVLPSHHGHEARSAELVRNMCRRFRTPGKYCDLAVLVAKYHGHYHRIDEMRPATIVKTLSAMDAFRQPERFQQFLLACEADSRGRTGYEDLQPEQAEQFQRYFDAANKIDISALIKEDMKGEAIKQAIRKARIKAVSATAGTMEK